MRYVGLDVGDGESAVAAFEKGSGIEPILLPVGGARSFLSAVGFLNGEIVVGERAYTDSLADRLSVRFKSRFTYDPARNEDMVYFVRGVLRELQENGELTPEDVFVVGCPAGWNAAARARYRDLLIRAGIRDPQIVSESRAAFLYAKYAKTVALDVDVLSKAALVVDLGSSTLDFAYIVGGRETGVGTFGDVALGGGLLDEELLRLCVSQCRDRERIEAVFRESRSWYSYCEIEARKLKEAYFSQAASNPSVSLQKTLRVCFDGVQKLPLKIDLETARRLSQIPLAALEGKSFCEAAKDALSSAARLTAEEPPELVMLTGGASRMPFFQQLCREAFPDAAVVCSPEPEFSIAKGLSYAGWVDANLKEFRKAIETEITEERVAFLVRKELPRLVPPAADVLARLLLQEAATPAAREWQRGKIETLEQLDEQLSLRAARLLSSPAAQEALAPVLREWLAAVGERLQALVDPVCDRYEVPRREMELRLHAVFADTNSLPLDAKSLARTPVLGAALATIAGALAGGLCGGGGVALIASGPLGFLAGALLGVVVSLLGTDALSAKLTKANLPLLLRGKSITKKLCGEAAQRKLREALEKELNAPDGAFQRQVTEDFSRSFKAYLTSVAQAAEIPIE